MKQKSLKMSDSFWQAVEDYRIEHHIKTWSEAIITLAMLSLLTMNKPIPETLPRRGGDHRSEKFRKTNSPVE